MLIGGIAARDLIAPAAAHVVLLCSNLGTALATWVVSAGIEVLAAPFILAGTGLARHRGVGRALTGAGLMLLSVKLPEQAAEPLRSSPSLAGFLPLLDSAWPVALMFEQPPAVVYFYQIETDQ